MSSHHISTSGARPFHLDAGGGVAQGISFNSVKEDRAKVLVSNAAGGIVAVLPQSAVIERYETARVIERHGEDREITTQWIVLRIPDNASLQLYGDGGESLLHTDVDVRRAEGDPLDAALGAERTLLEEVALASPPTV